MCPLFIGIRVARASLLLVESEDIYILMNLYIYIYKSKYVYNIYDSLVSFFYRDTRCSRLATAGRNRRGRAVDARPSRGSRFGRKLAGGAGQLSIYINHVYHMDLI